MSKRDGLRYGAPGENAVHICVDMQRMFAEDTEWKMPWLPRVLPNIVSISSAHPERLGFGCEANPITFSCERHARHDR
jgi:hypothetical protein